MLRNPLTWVRLLAEVARHRGEVRAVGYQTAIDVQGNLKGAVYSLLSGARQRISFAAGHDREFNHWFSNQRVEPPATRPHRVDKFASLLGPLGVEDERREWSFPDAGSSQERVADFLQAREISPGSAVLIHPGTSAHGAAKRWHPDRYAELGRRIVGELGRARRWGAAPSLVVIPIGIPS